jgi:hypothetical protein
MRRAAAALAARLAPPSSSSSAARPFATAPGTLSDYGQAAGVPDHILKRDVRRKKGGGKSERASRAARRPSFLSRRPGGAAPRPPVAWCAACSSLAFALHDRLAGKGKGRNGAWSGGRPRRRETIALIALTLPLPPPRQVIIYAPARTPSQQGMSNTPTPQGKGGAWRVEFETKPK